MAISPFTSTENLNITYLFGAGSSYDSVPIWNKQGDSMLVVAETIEKIIKSANTQIKYYNIFNNKKLISIVENLKEYSKKATEFGTLDIYARSLFLLEKTTELNELKYHLSVYFDLWENFIYKENFVSKDIKYSKIDKRYYSLLAVLLEKGDNNPKINKNISFLSWNYDLQIESAYKSFMLDSGKKSFKDVNLNFNFFDNNEQNNIAHLNGFRGFFNYEDELFPNVDYKVSNSIEDYLSGLIDSFKQFRISNIDYENNIKYAWESKAESLVSARKIMEKTNILIVIGYSFPSYNRMVDSELIGLLGAKSISNVKEVVIQNPTINTELISSIFPSNIKPKLIEDTSQFYIPHEFLFPQKGKQMIF